MGRAQEAKKLTPTVVTEAICCFFAACTVAENPDDDHFPVAWNGVHATRTNFTTLEDFLNNFFFKDLVPDSSGIAGMLSSWRQDGVKVFTRTKGGAVYYKTDRKQDDVFTFSSGTESKKGHLGHGVAKNGFSGRRFRNPESEQEMNELGTLLAKHTIRASEQRQ